MPDFEDLLFGSSGGWQKTPLMNQLQSQGLDRIFQKGLNAIENPYEGFEGLRQNTLNDFYQNIIPGISQQFIGESGGAASSPVFHSQLSSAGSGLAALLNAQRAEYGMQNKRYGLDAAHLGITPQFSNQYMEGSEGLLSQLLPMLAEGGLMYATGGLSGAPGIANLIGKGVSGLSSLFSKPTKPGSTKPVQSYQQYQDQINQATQSSRTMPYASRGFGPTSLSAGIPQGITL